MGELGEERGVREPSALTAKTASTYCGLGEPKQFPVCVVIGHYLLHD